MGGKLLLDSELLTTLGVGIVVLLEPVQGGQAIRPQAAVWPELLPVSSPQCPLIALP
jgi:hypothetical protein